MSTNNASIAQNFLLKSTKIISSNTTQFCMTALLTIVGVTLQETKAAHGASFSGVKTESANGVVDFGFFTRPTNGTLTRGLTSAPHDAVDIANSVGTEIWASAKGTVHRTGNDATDTTGYGNWVLLKHQGPNNRSLYTLYAHLNDPSFLSVGDSVSQGQTIGYMGNTGNSYGSHLHFTIFSNFTGNVSCKTRYPNPSTCLDPLSNPIRIMDAEPNQFDEAVARQKVSKAYQDMFGRNPSSSEVSRGINSLRSESEDEFRLSLARGNGRHVIKWLYEDLFGEEAPPEDSNLFKTRQSQLAVSYAHLRNRMINDGANSKIKPQIVRAFQEIEGRTPTDEEVDQAIDVMRQHASLVAVSWALQRDYDLFLDVPIFTQGEANETGVVNNFGDRPLYNPPTTHAFSRYIYNLVERGVIGGYADGTFRPDNVVNRGAASKFILNGFDLQDNVTSEFEPNFPDVDSSHPFYKEIAGLNELGIVDGYADGYFRPENTLTRGAVAKMIFNGALAEFGNISFDTSCGNFSDVGTDNAFYNYITTLKCDKVISGYTDKVFKPTNTVTRGALAKFVDNGYRFYKDLSEAQIVLAGVGDSQDNPVLPKEITNDWKIFSNVLSGLWYDPPTQSGLEYQALNDSLFHGFTLPTGLDADDSYTLVVGDKTLGQFSGGQSVSFINLLGTGVESFELQNIQSQTGESIDIPVLIDLDRRLGSFQVRSVVPENRTSESVPEPGFIAGFVSFALLGFRNLRKRDRS